MEIVLEFLKIYSIFNISEDYLILYFGIFILSVIFIPEFIAPKLVDLFIYIFRLGGHHGPTGSQLAQMMFSAVGETNIKIDETTLDSGFRMAFNEIDYRPDRNVLELTKDKAKRSNISSAGLVVLEVGRALQYKSGSVLVTIKKIMTPFVNFAGFSWILPVIGSFIIPPFVIEEYSHSIGYILYIITASLFGILGLYILLKIPLELDAYRRGTSVMVKAGIFSKIREFSNSYISRVDTYSYYFYHNFDSSGFFEKHNSKQ